MKALKKNHSHENDTQGTAQSTAMESDRSSDVLPSLPSPVKVVIRVKPPPMGMDGCIDVIDNNNCGSTFDTGDSSSYFGGEDFEMHPPTSISIGCDSLHYDYKFDQAFSARATQKEIYEHRVAPLVENVLNNYDSGSCCHAATVVTYGVTDTGKTYTMFGPTIGSGNNSDMMMDNETLAGIFPRTAQNLFEKLETKKKMGKHHGHHQLLEYEVSLQALALHGEEITDMLSSPTSSAVSAATSVSTNNTSPSRSPLNKKKQGGVPKLVIQESAAGEDPTVIGATQYKANDATDIINCLKHGLCSKREQHADKKSSKNFTTAISLFITQTVVLDSSSHHHHHSSSSHSNSKVMVIRSKLNFVDTAGSDKYNHKNGTHKRKSTTDTKKSLLVLGNVLSAVNNPQKHAFAPYRDSRLTHLFRSSLGGGGCYNNNNSGVLLVVCLSSNPREMEESLNSLRFAQRIKKKKGSTISRLKVDCNRHKVMNDLSEVKEMMNDISVMSSSHDSDFNYESSCDESSPGMHHQFFTSQSERPRRKSRFRSSAAVEGNKTRHSRKSGISSSAAWTPPNNRSSTRSCRSSSISPSYAQSYLNDLSPMDNRSSPASFQQRRQKHQQRQHQPQQQHHHQQRQQSLLFDPAQIANQISICERQLKALKATGHANHQRNNQQHGGGSVMSRISDYERELERLTEQLRCALSQIHTSVGAIPATGNANNISPLNLVKSFSAGDAVVPGSNVVNRRFSEGNGFSGDMPVISSSSFAEYETKGLPSRMEKDICYESAEYEDMIHQQGNHVHFQKTRNESMPEKQDILLGGYNKNDDLRAGKGAGDPLLSGGGGQRRLLDVVKEQEKQDQLLQMYKKKQKALEGELAKQTSKLEDVEEKLKVLEFEREEDVSPVVRIEEHGIEVSQQPKGMIKMAGNVAAKIKALEERYEKKVDGLEKSLAMKDETVKDLKNQLSKLKDENERLFQELMEEKKKNSSNNGLPMILEKGEMQQLSHQAKFETIMPTYNFLLGGPETMSEDSDELSLSESLSDTSFGRNYKTSRAFSSMLPTTTSNKMPSSTIGGGVPVMKNRYLETLSKKSGFKNLK